MADRVLILSGARFLPGLFVSFVTAKSIASLPGAVSDLTFVD